MKNVEDMYALSPMQQGMLFHVRSAPGSAQYFVQWMCVLKGILNIDAFEQVWQVIVNRHPSLRTIFLWEGLAEPIQVVRREAVLPWEMEDWRELSADAQDERLQQRLMADQQRGFDLAHAPLMRIRIIRTGDQAHQIIWSFHHLLLDGWSILQLLNEVFALYRAFNQGREAQLQPVRPYRDYIAWLQQQDLAGAEQFWRARLAGLSAPTPLVVDHQPVPGAPDRYADLSWSVPAATTGRLQAFAREHQLTPGTLVQGAWALLLHRYSGQEDVLFGGTVAGRPASLPGSDRMVGLFVNTLPVRVQTPHDASVLAWLKELQAQQAEARAYEHSPLAHVQRWSAFPPGEPLFTSLLSFENYPGGAFSLEAEGAGLQIHAAHAVERTNYPLNLSVMLGAELSLTFIYDERRFDMATITRMAGHFQTVLEHMTRNEEQQLRDLPLLTVAEEQQLATWNATARVVPRTCLHELFEQQVERAPNAVALSLGDAHLTYHELNQRANQVAHMLKGLGVEPDMLVGLSVERSFEMIIGLLGVLKAGGAFVPLDPTYPQDRLDFMAADSGINILLTQERLMPSWRDSTTIRHVVCLDRDWPVIAKLSIDHASGGATADNLAYVIYTSGSTGRPKGVLVEHTGIGNLVTAQIDAFGIGPDDRILQFAALSFDAAVFEIAMAICTGAMLQLAARDDLLPGPALIQLLQEREISTLTISPSVLAATDYRRR
jgi:non-ribosomal peptide synthetase component F